MNLPELVGLIVIVLLFIFGIIILGLALFLIYKIIYKILKKNEAPKKK